jgi:hypothetical protein
MTEAEIKSQVDFWRSLTAESLLFLVASRVVKRDMPAGQQEMIHDNLVGWLEQDFRSRLTSSAGSSG